MARELSQEALLDFLCQAGGRVTNAALLSHFKSFLRDPDASPSQHQRRRELFKGFVNSVAAVRQDPDGTKFVVLKRRYRDLLGEEGLQRPPDRATAGEEPAQASAALDDRGAPRQELEGAPAEPSPVLAAPLSPPPTVGATGSQGSPPAVQSRPSAEDPPELLTPGDLHYSTLQQQQQQQQRTQEWVARHPHIPQDQGPIRAWSVLPDNFPSELGFWGLDPNSATLDPTLSSHSHFPVSESWPGDSPLTVFRSIRCQLSLQDLDDFVDQESHGSEESSSGPKESPGGSEEGLHVALGTPDWRKLRNPAGDLSLKEVNSSRSPQGLRNRRDGHTFQQVPTRANGLVGHPQEPLPWSAPKFRRSLRRGSRAERTKLSSSDEECLADDLLKRSRRPPRSRKPSKSGAMSSPRVDAALTPKPADIKAALAERSRLHSLWAPSREEPTALVPHRPSEHKPSLVPLDAREHEWIVKLATGSWIQVLTLFWEDPQLALHKDFLTGYTALHWIAKHGDLRALQDLVSGAQKAGIALDVNVKSSCGYTPLHLAAIHGHQGVMKLLVQRLASRVNVRDSSGKKPWQYLTSNTSGEIWQLLGAPRGKPIFPVYSLVRSSSPTRKVKSREISRNISRKTSFAALLKSQHSKWKLANQYEKFPTPREREEYSD
ncbi:ankyrin repeat domain-containing protein SOWAHB [Pteropus vampyrus]|uniref:Ankyrin repeat domain-containing protein SOWAHB n=1 Tax=Pteropus vampyrus TaxID=132908 RepID=A0A6P3QEC0_PTEVA|nr:ankyrin repeat domain-containing protein SOWAHB [Pteropus vampyrus]